MSRRAAVLGRPINHSLSPALHMAAYRALGLTDWSYGRIDCGEAELPGLLAGLGPEWVGLSLTMPLKKCVLACADERSSLAETVGAANTLLLSPGRRYADNTDVAGITAAVRSAGPAVAGRAVVLGAGGTARAALAAAVELGHREVSLVVRDAARAATTLATGERLGLEMRTVAWPGDQPVAEAGLVISTVPAGVADGLASPRIRWAAGAVVLDVVYDPWPTALASSASAAGCRVVAGLDMLVHQAAGQVELMTGRPAPLAAMRAAVRSPLPATARVSAG